MQYIHNIYICVYIYVYIYIYIWLGVQGSSSSPLPPMLYPQGGPTPPLARRCVDDRTPAPQALR